MSESIIFQELKRCCKHDISESKSETALLLECFMRLTLAAIQNIGFSPEQVSAVQEFGFAYIDDYEERDEESMLTILICATEKKSIVINHLRNFPVLKRTVMYSCLSTLLKKSIESVGDLFDYADIKDLEEVTMLICQDIARPFIADQLGN